MTTEQPVGPFPPLEEAVYRLVDFYKAIETEPSETGGKDPVADERKRTMQELVNLAMFMEVVPELRGRERRLVALLRALQDVHAGRYPELFKKPKPKRKKRGKPKPELKEQFRRADAAAVLEFYIRADPAPRPNVTEIAQHVANSCARWFDNRPTATQVKDWRAAVCGNAEGDGAQRYRAIIDRVEAKFPDPEQAARYLLST